MKIRVIRKLNPMIRGWAQYHRATCAKQTYNWVDHQIWKCLWQWANRRHPDKGKKWIKDRYFHIIGSREWVFSVKEPQEAPRPKKQYLELYSAVSTKIKRHVKVKAGLNPFDPAWWGYLEARARTKHASEDELLGLFAEPAYNA